MTYRGRPRRSPTLSAPRLAAATVAPSALDLLHPVVRAAVRLQLRERGLRHSDVVVESPTRALIKGRYVGPQRRAAASPEG